MARRKKEEEHENHERWLVSYADFITLLFAFFVVMYAISSVNEGKYRVMSGSIIEAFNKPDSVSKVEYSTNSAGSSQPNRIVMDLPAKPQVKPDTPKIEAAKSGAEMKEVVDNLQNVLEPLLKNGLVKLTLTNRGISIEINASLLFSPAQATLSQEAVTVLQAVAKVLVTDTHQIQIEGHTDNLPIASPVFPSNWELSTARASSVIRLFTDNGIAKARMVAIGYADNRPLDNSDTPEGRAKNRRVTVMVLAEKQGDSNAQVLDPDIKPETTAAPAQPQATSAQPASVAAPVVIKP